MAKRGRKSAWETKIEPRLFEIAGLARDGYTDAQICDYLGVHVATFCKYKKDKTELSETLKTTKAIADLTVENSLYKRAIGYTYEETVKEVTKNSEGNIVSSHVKKTEKSIVPDVTAQIFWLKNRKMKEWRDTKNMDHSNADKDTDILKQLSEILPD